MSVYEETTEGVQNFSLLPHDLPQEDLSTPVSSLSVSV